MGAIFNAVFFILARLHYCHEAQLRRTIQRFCYLLNIAQQPLPNVAHCNKCTPSLPNKLYFKTSPNKACVNNNCISPVNMLPFHFIIKHNENGTACNTYNRTFRHLH